MKDAEKTIGNILNKQSIVYIGSVDEDGFPNTKAMLAPRKREGIKVFYFHTNTHSMRVSQYKSNPKANLYFCDKRFFRGVMLVGTMEVLEDAAHDVKITIPAGSICKNGCSKRRMVSSGCFRTKPNQ